MSVARHHTEWLRLVETSGPFLSMPVLMRAFPQGLDQRDPAKASRLREAYEDWQERGAKQPAVHLAWIKHVLTELLEYPPGFLVEGQAMPPGMEAVMPTAGETLRPAFALKHRDAGKKPLLLIDHYKPDQDLEKPVAGKIWKASPGTRMMELLHAADVTLGLITNGEQWMIVYAPRGETTGFASWFADLWMQEPITLRAFHSLLHLRRFMGVAEPETLPALYAESSKDQQEVTDQLGYQVRRAVELLVQAFDGIDVESGRTLFAGVREKDIYDGALTVMMRLVFLFSAEERGLLLLGDPLYDQHYAVSTLRDLLREMADKVGEEVLERRHDAWSRLLATFRAVHGGVEHEAMRLPPYGGTLFDPDRFTFLEGRPAGTRWRTDAAKPLPVNNRVVLHLLEALQILRVKVPGGGPAETRRVSFRALDIEQIGYVYEGLLDHTARRAAEPVLGLVGNKDHEPEIPLSRLEELRAGDKAKFIEFLKDETGRSEKALAKILETPGLADPHELHIACGQDHRLVQRVSPFIGILRRDDFQRLEVIPAGSVYVTRGSDRRSTGTHYTPRILTEPIVQHTLDPLIYVGPAEGRPQNEWQLKSPKEILAIKVCDLAMGSGAFLVQTCRYLSEKLVEAWETIERAANLKSGISTLKFIKTPDGELSSGDPRERLLPADADERLAIARRYVADRCLYGVDINPMAVEMAKLSLWLVTLRKDRPFTFLDHAFKCGDSLLGVSDLKQIENFSLRPGVEQITFATANLFRYVADASAKRQALEDLPSNDQTQIATKHRLHTEAEAATAKVKAVADCLIALELRGLNGNAYETAREGEAEKLQRLIQHDADASLKSELSNVQSSLSAHAREQLSGRRPFHWAVEFPEVFTRGGFDAFVGNPPFMGGRNMANANVDYKRALEAIWPDIPASADLCAPFFRRAFALTGESGCFGLLATNTIAQGSTREGSLLPIHRDGGVIYRAEPNKLWPGVAGVCVSVVHVKHGTWNGPFMLWGQSVSKISTYLDDSVELGDPYRLEANGGKSFQGCIPRGTGFFLEPDEAKKLIEDDARNKTVIQPFLNGDDVTSRPDQSPSRYIINFGSRSLEEAKKFPASYQIVLEKVLPSRKSVRNERVSKEWWLFEHKGEAMYRAVKPFPEVLVATQTSKFLCICFSTVDLVFSQTLVVFGLGATSEFSLLASTIHQTWVEKYAATLETRMRYLPTDCFETFPFPPSCVGLSSIGSRYHEFRRQIMLTRQEGLTKTYNRFHDRGEKSEDIARLRALHVEMDQAVAAAYGWTDLDLGHDFHPTKQGIRYTISEPARRTVLDRLLALNHQRHAEELAAGLHDKKPQKTKKAAKPAAPQQPGEPLQFGLGLAVPDANARTLPGGFRFAASDPSTYAVNLVTAILSEAGGTLPWTHLRDAFVFATRPDLMKKYAAPADGSRVDEWKRRWNEKATPKLLPACLKALHPGNIFIRKQEGGFIFQLADGPRPAANEDVGYDAWLGLMVSAHLNGKAVPLPESEEWLESIREMIAA